MPAASVQKTWVCPEVYRTRDINVFKKYCKDIRDHLDLVMVRTDDTGQVDIDAMVAPNWATIYNNMGYLIYRFDDPMQATNPIYMRIEFWTLMWSTNTTNNTQDHAQGGFQTRFIFGTATDGAGAITNPSWTFYSPVSTADDNTSAEASSRYADRNGVNYLTYNEEQGFIFFAYGAQAGYRAGTGAHYLYYNLAMFSVQRTLDDYGQPDGRGFVVVARNDGFQSFETINFLQPRVQTYIYGTNAWTNADRTHVFSHPIGELGYNRMPDDKFIVFPLKYWDPDFGVRSLPNLLYMAYSLDYPGARYTVETIPNRPRKFKSLGSLAMWRPTDRAQGDYGCIVLWE